MKNLNSVFNDFDNLIQCLHIFEIKKLMSVVHHSNGPILHFQMEIIHISQDINILLKNANFHKLKNVMNFLPRSSFAL